MDDSRREQCRWHQCFTARVDEIELCNYHFDLIGRTYIDKRSIFGSAWLASRRPEREARRAEWVAIEQTKDDWSRSRSVVYYVRLDRHVKIGYTVNLTPRISSLRVDRDAVMAVEPGWREVEAERHQQFAEERVGKREDFNPSRRLLAHIDVVRSKYGDPLEFAARRVTAAGMQPIVG